MTKISNKNKKQRSNDPDIAGYSSGVVGSASNYADNVVFNSVRGHGFAAEKVNHLHDVFTGKDAKLVGGDNAKNGADRIVNGTQIQTKYCNSGSKCISEAFKDGQLRYWNADGTPMQIEVPSDKYDSAVQAMEERIKKGQVKGLSNPEKAKEIVIKGSYTYEQAKNIAKAGTIESLSYDAVNGVEVAGTAMGVSSVISFAVAIWNKEELDVALEKACHEGLRIGSIVWVSSILTAQVGKTGIEQGLRGSTDWAVNQMGPKAASWIANSVRSGSSSLSGGAAMKSASKLLRGNIVAGTVTTLVLSSADFVRLFDGRVSGKQVFKNFTRTAAGVAGGTGGWMGGASVGAAVGSAIPLIGTAVGGIVGGIIGSLAGGSAATAVTSDVLDSFIEDDAKEMLSIVEESFGQLAEDYLLTENEAKSVIDEFQAIDIANVLRDMYASSDRVEFARSFLEPSCENQLRQRPKIKLPSDEKIIKSIRGIIEGLIDTEEAANKEKVKKRQREALLWVLALGIEWKVILEFGFTVGGVLFLMILLIIKARWNNYITFIKVEKTEPERSVGIFLAIGILFVPYVFSFLTLRKGYSMVARSVAMGWLLGILVLSFFSTKPTSTIPNPKATDLTQSSSASWQIPLQALSDKVHITGDITQEAEQTKSDAGILKAQKEIEQSQQLKNEMEREDQEVQSQQAGENTQAGIPETLILDSHAMVHEMLKYALDDGGLAHESEIQQTKLQIEDLPKPEQGNRKAARALNENGLVLFKSSDFNNAVKMFEEANQLDKSDVEIVGNLGFSYLKQGSLNFAQQALIETLTLSPDRSTAWANLGEVFALMGDISKAVGCFSNAYRFSKDRLKNHQFMKKINEKENVENVKKARSIAIDWAEKTGQVISDTVGDI